jgi:hypothetical protein
MASRTGQEIRLKQYPKGMPTEDIFELASRYSKTKGRRILST